MKKSLVALLRKIATHKVLTGVFSKRRSIQQILERTEGGIFKRIDENRELAELLLREVPSLLFNHPSLLHWLKAQDRFLIELSGQPTYHKGRCLFRPRKGLPRHFDFVAVDRRRDLEMRKNHAGELLVRSRGKTNWPL